MEWDVFSHHKFPVRRDDQVGELRRLIRSRLQQLGFSEKHIACADLVATEMANNLLRHTPKGGEVLFCGRTRMHQPQFEMISLDKGPGIANIIRAMQDGFSTAGGPGIGLGTMQRNADEFEMFSRPGSGTAILIRMWEAAYHSETADKQEFSIGGIAVPAAGETLCGDGWHYHDQAGELTVAVVDGLGHGEKACEAAWSALKAFDQMREAPLPDMMRAMNRACRSTRGAAAFIARISTVTHTLQFTGIGNISACVVSPDGTKKGLPSMNGILGAFEAPFTVHALPWQDRNYLVLHSDGILNRWKGKVMLQRPRELTLKAAILYRDYCKGYDDATMVIAQVRRG